MVRVRFAPSPTGYLHIGNARTAIFNWIFSKKTNGRFILRIEDTDIERSAEVYFESIMQDLLWLGLNWDEGPLYENGKIVQDKQGAKYKGSYGPYKQSERKHIYREKIEYLLERAIVYPCYCQEDELEERRRCAVSKGIIPRYDNRCRYLTDKQKAELISKNISPAIRFKVPEDRVIVVDDLIRGKVGFDSNLIGDFIIAKKNLESIFDFAVVVDDGEMNITHIIRGEDHLSNTPRHILLFQALGYNLPQYAHMSLTFNERGEKLSKRNNALSIRKLKEDGYMSSAVVNYLSLLGWGPKSAGHSEVFLNIDELIKGFSIEGMNKSSCLFDKQKLDFISQFHTKNTPKEKLFNLLIEYLKNAQPELLVITENYRLQLIIEAVADSISTFKEAIPFIELIHSLPEFKYDFDGEQIKILAVWRDIISNCDEINPKNFKTSIAGRVSQITGAKTKELYRPLRIAITGAEHGPALNLMVSAIGKQEILIRLEKSIARRKNALSGMQ